MNILKFLLHNGADPNVVAHGKLLNSLCYKKKKPEAKININKHKLTRKFITNISLGLLMRFDEIISDMKL